jgi:hypothetical protein
MNTTGLYFDLRTSLVYQFSLAVYIQLKLLNWFKRIH